MDDNDPVISGISGRYPESANIYEFWNNLAEGKPMYTCDERRWPIGTISLPPFNGNVKDIRKTDYKFFKYNKRDIPLDPQTRILHEVIYEAIFDAGIIPEDLRGSKTSLLVGLCNDDTMQVIYSDVEAFLTIEGISYRDLTSISRAFGFNGPTGAFDTACASSFTALREGVLQMKAGLCDQMIIGGVACQLSPFNNYAFSLLRMISPDGLSKCLDASVNGYCRSESINALFLQKRKQAKRIYASIMTIKMNCDGFKPEGITFPGFPAQRKLMRETIKAASIDPESINYIEAHITGTIVGDPVESKAIIEAYRDGSEKPIMFGCLKSNIGHTEGASANCAITKVALIFQKHCIPPNLNYKTPNPNIEALVKGQIIPVIETKEFHDEIIPVNAFGFGGVNVHALLKANEKVVTQESYKTIENIFRLVNISGRTEEGLEYAMNWIETNRKDVTKEFLALLNEVSKTRLETGMNCRAFMVMDETRVLQRRVFKGEKRRPLWFVFSALGCQWKAMGKQMMQIPTFSDSIHKCAKVAKSVTIDLIDILTNIDNDYEKDIIKTLVAIVSVQIALLDTLSFLELKPDGIIGYSLGDVVAGYCDGCLSAEQAVLIAYYIGKCSFEAQKEKGSMAAVGLNWEIALERCPLGVYPACDNGNDGITISGTQKDVKQYVEELKLSNTFAVEVDSCEMAYHSPLVKQSYESLKTNIETVIKKAKRRSNKWLSTVIKSCNDLPFCDATFFATNVVSPVWLKDTLKNVPQDACIVEVGPHSILLPLIKRQLQHSMCIPLLKKNSECSVIDILSGIGEIYCSGNNTYIENLYQKVEYPVPRETLSLSHLLKWEHSENIFTVKYPDNFQFFSFDYRSININLADVNYSFLSSHCIDGRNLYPATGYLYSIWAQLAFGEYQSDISSVPVEFRNVRFQRATLLPKDGSLELYFYRNEYTGQFAIMEGASVCVTGIITTNENRWNIDTNVFIESDENAVLLEKNGIYKELRVRGYDYGPSFQGLVEAYSDGSKGKVKATGHWVSLTDSMLHLAILSNDQRRLCVPTYIEYMKCDPQILFSELKKNGTVDVHFDKYANIGSAPGLVIKGLKVSPVPKRVEQVSNLSYLKFHRLNDIVKTPIDKMQHFQNYEQCCLRELNALYSHQIVSEDEKCEFDDNSLNEYALYQKLKSSERESFDFNTFFDSLTKEDRNCFLFETNFDDLLKAQLYLLMDNMIKEAKIIEYNTTCVKLEDVFYELAYLKQLKLQYSCYPLSGESKLPVTISNLDVIVYKCWSTQLIVDNKNWTTDLELNTLLESFFNAMKNGGFICVYFRTKLTELENRILTMRSMLTFDLSHLKIIKEHCVSMGLKLIAESSDDIGFVSLLFRKIEAIERRVVIKPTHENFDWVEKVKEEIKKDDQSIWLLGNENINGVFGLSNCLRREPEGNKIHSFIGDETLLTAEIFEKGLSTCVVEREEVGFYTIKNVKEPTVATKDAYLDLKTKGDLTSFQWLEAPHKHWDSLSLEERDPNQSKVHVFYSALNFKDIMVATGRIPLNAYPDKWSFGCLGMEFSGIDENSNRICGLCVKNTIATTLIIDEDTSLTFPVPEGWSLEDAATVPVVYFTVYYSLIIRGKLLPKETVLIHAGSGGVGQAAITVCLSMGCEVFTSVGSEEKKQFLKDLFPKLQEKHFVNSRDVSFEEHILKETNGRGVDIVLNSLAEEKLRASINCMADFGRFIEIGKFDIVQDNPFDSSRFQKNISFHGVCVAHLIQQFYDKSSPQAMTFYPKLISLVNEGLKSGAIKPLKRTVFLSDETEKAFRFMASGKHIGKVLIKIRDEEENKKLLKPLTVTATPQTYLHSNKVYILVGGLGGIGLELGQWLIDRGAKKFVLTSRTGIKNNYQKYRIQKFEMQGAEVKVVCNDASTLELTYKLVNESMEMGEIGGIFNLAMVLSDALIENQNEETYRTVCIPKVNTTLFLDEISRNICSQLDYFVCFSSLAAGIGNAAQSNYGFANSLMESICKKRRDDNLHGVAIQWGAVGDVGFILENFKTNDIVLLGTMPQRIPSCMKAIDTFINSSGANYSSYVSQDGGNSIVGSGGDLMKKITHILGVGDPSTLDDTTTLGDLGLDSLMAVEIKQGIERDYNTVMSTQEIRQLTVIQIKELSAKKTNKVLGVISDAESDYKSNFENPKELFTKLDNGNHGVPIFFIPPIEGDFKLMKPLIEHISRPVIGINWTDELDPLMSIEEVASFYVKNVRERYPQPEYEFVAYSFGSLIAFEMGVQLQEIDMNSVRKLLILDGDIDFMKHRTLELMKKGDSSNEKEAFVGLLLGFMALIYPMEAVEKLQNEIISLSTKEAQIKRTVEFIEFLGYEKCSEELLKLAVERSFNKLKRVHFYSPTKKFKGKVKLFCSTREANDPEPNSTNSVFYKLIDGTLDTKTFTGDHRSFLTFNNREIGSIIDSEHQYISL